MTEAQYDTEIAPLLLELSKTVREAGGGFVALVAFDEGQGRTANFPDDSGPEIRLAYYGAACKGNADTLISQLIKDAKRNGDNSIYLNLLRRATEPLS